MSSNKFVTTVTRIKHKHSGTNHDMISYTRCSTSSVVRVVTF